MIIKNTNILIIVDMSVDFHILTYPSNINISNYLIML